MTQELHNSSSSNKHDLNLFLKGSISAEHLTKNGTATQSFNEKYSYPN